MKLSISSIIKAFDWRIRALIGNSAVDSAIVKLGLAWRPALKRPIFIGIAGSAGKTTAKDLLVGILSKQGGVVGNYLSLNMAPEIAKIILRVRPWHRFCVAELGETKPGSLDNQLDLLRPTVAIITTIRDDHLSEFGSREAIAREIAKVARSIHPGGTVVLNLDDVLVSPMSDGLLSRIITYGISEEADLRAEDIESAWPNPLKFTVTYKGQALRISTQLYGRQLLTSALAAIGGGLAAGLSLDDCGEGIRTVPAAEGRMQPVRCASGITFLRDDFKAPRWTIGPLLEQFAAARARRKIFVLGTISDFSHKEKEYPKIAKQALGVADITIITGRFASAALKARDSVSENRLHAFTNIRDACAFLHSICRDGDLIVLKGTNKNDHLSRISLSFSQEVNCWIDDCKRDMFCSECSHVNKHHGLPDAPAARIQSRGESTPANSNLPVAGQHDHVIIGLGNPGIEFADTPHNVGYEALDYLSNLLGIKWQDYPEALIAYGIIKGQHSTDHGIWLIKVKCAMNLTGQLLGEISGDMGFCSNQCVLVFDDVNLPLGTVRTKMSGSSGGHRGVASILDAFQTDNIRRVKIGVTSGEKKAATVANVLRKFDLEDREKIKPALHLASTRIVELVSC